MAVLYPIIGWEKAHQLPTQISCLNFFNHKTSTSESGYNITVLFNELISIAAYRLVYKRGVRLVSYKQ